MEDHVYEEGFPDRWFMVHRDDCTLLARRGDMGPPVTICASPKLVQGEAWLSTAKEIAHALAGVHRYELDRMFDEFCDECGVGPPHDENDQPMPNVRASRTWKCDRCSHANIRPKVDIQHSADDMLSSFAEIERLVLARDEGTLAKRAYRIREIACKMQGKPVPCAPEIKLEP